MVGLALSACRRRSAVGDPILKLAEGHYSALFVTVPVERDVAEALVPEGTELRAQELTGEGTHPLLLMFGHHTRVHPTFLPIRGWSYHEFLVAIPWIGRPDHAEVCSTMPRLYLDSWPMVLAGWIYAFPKARARVTAGEGSYDVKPLFGGETVVSAEWSVTGEAGPVDSIANFAAVAPTFGQPFLQRFRPLPIERSVMTFGLDDAVIQNAEATVELTPFLPGLSRTGFDAVPLSQAPTGAFTIEVPWTLSLPSFV